MANKMEIVRGTSNVFGITVTDAVGNKYFPEGDAVLVFGLKKSSRDEKCVLVKAITHRANDEYLLEFYPADTVNLECGQYFYDVGIQVGKSVLFPVIEWSEFVIKPNAVKCGDV